MTPKELKELLKTTTKKSKFNNRRCKINGITFASKKEGERYTDLLLLLRAGEITNLKLQQRIKIFVNSEYVCTYVADFTYTDKDGKSIVEDAKGLRLPIYLLKKRLLFLTQGIDILET